MRWCRLMMRVRTCKRHEAEHTQVGEAPLSRTVMGLSGTIPTILPSVTHIVFRSVSLPRMIRIGRPLNRTLMTPMSLMSLMIRATGRRGRTHLVLSMKLLVVVSSLNVRVRSTKVDQSQSIAIHLWTIRSSEPLDQDRDQLHSHLRIPVRTLSIPAIEN